MASLQQATDDVLGLGLGLGDEFVAYEILARLPARCAVRCTVLSKRFRQLLATTRFWLRHQRLGAPPEVPHVARLFRPKSCTAWEFHAASPTFAMKHTVVDAEEYGYASTCNGLVLMSSVSKSNRGQSSVEGVVFNPATREEARLSLPLPDPGDKNLWRRILGFGYGPSSKVYKALIREVDVDQESTRLMVVPLDGSTDSGQQEPRTVFSSHRDIFCTHSLHTGDGKVYFLTCTTYFAGEEGRQEEIWETTPVLAFDVDDEAVTSIALPEPNGQYIDDFMMLEIRGRPCIYMTEDEEDTAIWLLTPDHRWEQLYTLVKQSAPRGDDSLVGAWDCRGGLLLAVFTSTGVYLYNLHEPAVEDDDNRLAALSSLTVKYEWPNCTWFGNPADLFDYRPTLISPASIFSDAAFSSRPTESVAPTHDLGGMFLEKTHKWIIDPAMQMLTNLEEAELLDPTKIGVTPLKD